MRPKSCRCNNLSDSILLLGEQLIWKSWRQLLCGLERGLREAFRKMVNLEPWEKNGEYSTLIENINLVASAKLISGGRTNTSAAPHV